MIILRLMLKNIDACHCVIESGIEILCSIVTYVSIPEDIDPSPLLIFRVPRGPWSSRLTSRSIDAVMLVIVLKQLQVAHGNINHTVHVLHRSRVSNTRSSCTCTHYRQDRTLD